MKKLNKNIAMLISLVPTIGTTLACMSLTSCKNNQNFIPAIIKRDHINVSVQNNQAELNKDLIINYELDKHYLLGKIVIRINNFDLQPSEYKVENNKIIVNGRTVTTSDVVIDLIATPSTEDVQSITIKQKPTTQEYSIGEKFSSAGLILHAKYKDGYEVDIDRGFTTDYDDITFSENDVGEITVTIYFGIATATTTIIVNNFKRYTGPMYGRCISGHVDINVTFKNYEIGHLPDLWISINGEKFEKITTLSQISVEEGDIFVLKGNNPEGLAINDGREYTNIQFYGVGGSYVELGGSVLGLINDGDSHTPSAIPLNSTFYRLFKESNAITKVSKNFLDVPYLTPNCFEEMFQDCNYMQSGPDLPDVPLEKECCKGMFRDCPSMKKMPALPSKELAESCYENMFISCNHMDFTDAVLPAETLAPKCYYHMFEHSINITNAPEIKATKVASACCQSMFASCYNLETVQEELYATTLAPNCYAGMFSECEHLAKTPKLPATTLAPYCYSSMFNRCISLTEAPELPATDLTGAPHCYSGMFSACKFTTAPALPAKTLSEHCYSSMFKSNKNLTALTKPTGETNYLPATTITNYCYNGMFYECESLDVDFEILPATTLKTSCYSDMFKGCKSLTKAPKLPAKTLTSSCYFGMFWDCENLETLPPAYENDSYIPSDAQAQESGPLFAMFFGCKKLKVCEDTLPAGATKVVTIFKFTASCTGKSLCDQMFDDTGGTFKGTPTINHEYILYTGA